MKKIFLAMALPLLLFSCTPERDQGSLEQVFKKKSFIEAANGNNPFDECGNLRNKILDSVLALHPHSSSLEEVIGNVKSVTKLFPEFNSFKTTHYRELSASELLAYINYAGDATALSQSMPLQGSGSRFVLFVDGLLNVGGSTFEANYDWITGYESSVVSSSYTPKEKEILLVVSSIERYAAYYRKKPKDKDWDLLIGNIAATAQGATHDMATAVLFSVAFEAALHTAY